jgi:hypothetical protein
MREHNARPPVLRGNIYAYVRLYAGAIKGKHVPCTRGRETERQTERERERERERDADYRVVSAHARITLTLALERAAGDPIH